MSEETVAIKVSDEEQAWLRDFHADPAAMNWPTWRIGIVESILWKIADGLPALPVDGEEKA